MWHLQTIAKFNNLLEGDRCNYSIGEWGYPAAVYCGCLSCGLWRGLRIWDWDDGS